MKKIFIKATIVLCVVIGLILGMYRQYNNVFVPDPSPYGVLKIANFPDGKLLIGRRFTYGFNEQVLMRLNSDGTVDNTFKIGKGFSENKDQYEPSIGIRVGISAILIQNDGKIILGGRFGEYNGEKANNIIRLNSDGSIDPTFETGTGFDESVYVLVQQDDKILVGGRFYDYNGEQVGHVTRLNNNGGIDKTFITKNFSGGEQILALPNNQILIGGSFMTVGNYKDGNLEEKNLVRLNSDETFDSTFIDHRFNPYCNISTILRLPDGKIMVGGNFQTYAGVQVNGIVRLLKDGTIDTSFNKQGSGFDVSDDNTNQVNAIEVLPNGKLLVGGLFTHYNGEKVGNIITLDRDGNIDRATKLAQFDQLVRDIHLTGENVWIGGDFFEYGSENAVGLMKIPLKTFE